MKTLLKTWNGEIVVNGKKYTHNNLPVFDFKAGDKLPTILLLPKGKEARKTSGSVDNSGVTDTDIPQEVVITVKKYMTEKASPGFEFMAQRNNDIPMPLRTMVGVKVKETPGMVYMKLHGDIISEKNYTCMKCGKKLTNSVSQYFGIGPECGNHNYVNPFDTDDELRKAVNEYKKTLQAVTWEGWIIKSAIQKEVIYDTSTL